VVSEARPQTHARAGAPAARIAVALGVVLLTLLGAATASAGDFRRLDSSQIQGTKLYDLGVADANGDGLLDIFTTNHKFDSSLLAGDGAGGFTDVFASSGLSPTQEFPGYEDLHREPDRGAPGLYLYATDRDQPRDPFHIATTGVAASGTLTFDAQDLQVQTSVGATVTTDPLPDGGTQLHFDALPGAQIDLTVEHIDLPINVAIDPPLDPSQIRVGADVVPATSRGFVLTLRDRHGFGFADYDGDLATDVFVATGGLGGEIVDPFFTGRQNDELLLARPGGYLDAIAGSGLVKGVCRGRSVRPADFDGDGDLDVLETCDGAPPQLYLGDGRGHFASGPSPTVVGTVYRLADLGRDGSPELLAAVGPTLQVWSFADGAWTLRGTVGTLSGESPPQTLSVGDVDTDGDLDVLATARAGNTFLLNVDGTLHRRKLAKLGLPPRGTFAASFADYDNDGDLDVDLVPQGLYESEDGTFRRTGDLRYGQLPEGRIGYGVVSWPDLNADGRRDVLSARERGEFAAEAVVDLRLNVKRRTGHWLEVDLLGPRGNRQSIGANLKVRTEAGWQYAWVGESEDSRYSSGHYRIYLGLGDERRIRKLVARWPDGSKAVRRDLRVDRLLRIPAKR
jgi:ASPIC/UnbV protein/VCBS repeat protein